MHGVRKAMIRKARMEDVKEIHKLIENFAKQGEMLPRSLVEIYEYLRDYFVFQEEDGFPIYGVCALHFCWENMAEIRSLAVREEQQGKGIGSRLVESCITEAKNYGIAKLFCLTYKPEFFSHFGFTVVEKTILPQKIWGDCIKCPEFPDCGEIALMRELSETDKSQ